MPKAVAVYVKSELAAFVKFIKLPHNALIVRTTARIGNRSTELITFRSIYLFRQNHSPP